MPWLLANQTFNHKMILDQIARFLTLKIFHLLRFPWHPSAVSHLRSCHSDVVDVKVRSLDVFHSSVAMPRQQQQRTTGAYESVCSPPSWIPPRFPSAQTGSGKLDSQQFLGHIFRDHVFVVGVLCLLIHPDKVLYCI